MVNFCIRRVPVELCPYVMFFHKRIWLCRRVLPAWRGHGMSILAFVLGETVHLPDTLNVVTSHLFFFGGGISAVFMSVFNWKSPTHADVSSEQPAKDLLSACIHAFVDEFQGNLAARNWNKGQRSWEFSLVAEILENHLNIMFPWSFVYFYLTLYLKSDLW